MAKKEEILKGCHEQAWHIATNPLKTQKANKLRIGKLYENLIRLPHTEDNFPYEDLYKMFDRHFKFRRKSANVTVEDIKEMFNRYIFTRPSIFNFYFRLRQMVEFPPGYQIGSGKLYPFDMLPIIVQNYISRDDYLIMHQKGMEESKSVKLKHDWFMHVQVRSVGSYKAREKAIKEVKRNLGVIKLFYRRTIQASYQLLVNPPFTLYYLSEDGTKSGLNRPLMYSNVTFTRMKSFDNIINDVNIIIEKEKEGIATNLESRILNAIDMCEMIDNNTPLHIKFILCVVALEGLLLDKGDKDYLGWKFAEKLSFILVDSKGWMDILNEKGEDKIFTSKKNTGSSLPETRAKLYETAKTLYNKRSAFTHTGLGEKNKKSVITIDDCNLVYSILKIVIEKFIELSKNGVTHINKSKKLNLLADDASFDVYIEKMKFA